MIPESIQKPILLALHRGGLGQKKGGAWSLLGQGLARGLDRMGHDWMPWDMTGCRNLGDS